MADARQIAEKIAMAVENEEIEYEAYERSYFI